PLPRVARSTPEPGVGAAPDTVAASRARAQSNRRACGEGLSEGTFGMSLSLTRGPCRARSQGSKDGEGEVMKPKGPGACGARALPAKACNDAAWPSLSPQAAVSCCAANSKLASLARKLSVKSGRRLRKST